MRVSMEAMQTPLDDKLAAIQLQLGERERVRVRGGEGGGSG